MVRVIGVSGEILGVMKLAAASSVVMKAGLDLVEVDPSAKPPVCPPFHRLGFDKYVRLGMQPLLDGVELRTTR
jgi:translation initiation factor IF-3